MRAARSAVAARRGGIGARSAVLVLSGMTSIQLGNGLAVTVFHELGPLPVVCGRFVFGGAALAALARRALPSSREEAGAAVVLGVVLAVMNSAFYLALDRIPLGTAATYAFLGPLAVAVFGSRRRRDLVWAGLALAGIALLSAGRLAGDPLGVAFALLNAAGWAAYILLLARAGSRSGDTGMLASATLVAAALSVPAALASRPHAIAVGAAAMVPVVALLCTVVPLHAEFAALRRMPRHVFGVLMSLEPAIASLWGLLVLGQGVSAREGAALALVVIASAGASAYAVPAP